MKLKLPILMPLFLVGLLSHVTNAGVTPAELDQAFSPPNSTSPITAQESEDLRRAFEEEYNVQLDCGQSAFLLLADIIDFGDKDPTEDLKNFMPRLVSLLNAWGPTDEFVFASLNASKSLFDEEHPDQTLGIISYMHDYLSLPAVSEDIVQSRIPDALGKSYLWEEGAKHVELAKALFGEDPKPTRRSASA